MIDKKKNRRFISLNLKITGVILIGVIVAGIVFVLCTYLEDTLAYKFYLSDEATEKSANEAYGSLEKYIKQNKVKATDSTELSNWLKTREYTYLFVYDNNENVFEAGWWVDSDAYVGELKNEEYLTFENDDSSDRSRIDEETFVTDASNRIVTFADGKYYVYLKFYGEEKLYNVLDIAKIVLCLLTLFINLLLYNGALIKRVINLSNYVKNVSEGNLKSEIVPTHNDELGRLATGVDNMRSSIIEKLENEKDAWEANTQLITSMSHDIRTPLTSLIGYLDIIEGEKYNDEEEFKRYISSCRDKAFQLKDLSDKLFQYFLVFGSPEIEGSREILDAGILFQQLLVEHVAEATSYGYNLELSYRIPEVNVDIDISGVRRLFDNVFSNILKYAAKKQPIKIDAYCVDKEIRMIFINQISEHARKVESTRIGVKTCERICSQLGGSFSGEEKGDLYITNISFPVVENKKA